MSGFAQSFYTKPISNGNMTNANHLACFSANEMHCPISSWRVMKKVIRKLSTIFMFQKNTKTFPVVKPCFKLFPWYSDKSQDQAITATTPQYKEKLTPIGEQFSTNLSSCDLAVPGSPRSNTLMSPLRVRPSGSLTHKCTQNDNSSMHTIDTMNAMAGKVHVKNPQFDTRYTVYKGWLLSTCTTVNHW